MQTFPVSCNKDCGGGCPLLAHVDKGQILRISNNPAGTTYMKGCNKGFQAHRMDYHPDRLKKPLIRKDDAPRTLTTAEDSRRYFREASWEEALDLAASRLTHFKEKHGCTSLVDLSSGGGCRGVFHNNSHQTARFLTLWGGATRNLSSYSSGAASFTLPHVFGTKQTGMDAGNLIHSKMIILWGYNAIDTRFGCEMPPRIMEAKKRGIPIVVIDPRRTRTAKSLGTWWIPIKPGGDTALMSAILYYLIRNNLQDHEFIEKYSCGFPALKSYIMGKEDGIPKNPEWAASLCGIPARDIEKLADMIGRIKPLALLPGLSLQRAIGGEEATRMPTAIQLATGNIGIKGGSSGGMFWGKMPQPFCPGLPIPEHSDPGFPVYEWPDIILSGKKGIPSLKGAYITGSNFLVQGSDIQKNIRAFQELELIIGHDFFLTPTMGLCDIVFPIASFLERNDVVKPAGNFILYSAKAIEPPEGVFTDYQIFTELSSRMGFESEFTEGKSAEQWIDQLLNQSDIPDMEDFKQSGIFMGEEQDRVAFSDFIKSPHEHPLSTPSGRIEISPESWEQLGFAAYPHNRSIHPEDPRYPLYLVTPHSLQGIHSQFGNVEGFRKEEDLKVWMNPQDAEARQIGPENTISLESPEGKLELPVKISDDIRPGCVSLNEGLWPRLQKEPEGLVEKGGSVNILSSTEPTLPSRSARTHTIFVNAKIL